MLSRLARIEGTIWGIAVFGYLIAPTLLVIVMSFGKDAILRFPPHLFSTRWYEEFFASEEWLLSTVRSFGVAGATAVGATLIGTAAALALVRGNLPWRRTIELFALSPMILPPIVLAIGGYGIFLKLGFVGSLAGLVAVHTVLTVPFVILMVSAALIRSDQSLELASMNLGAGPWTTLRRVTLPLILPAMLTGGLFAFITSFDEVVLALFLVGTVAPTLPLKIFSGIVFGVTPVVAAVSTIQIVITLIGLVFLYILRDWQKKRGTNA